MKINSRRKGKRGELEFARFCSDLGYPARRGQQFRGGSDSPDVVIEALPIHCEVKLTERLSLYDAMDQAKRDAGEGKIPVVFHRRNHSEWVAILPADVLLKLVDESEPAPLPGAAPNGAREAQRGSQSDDC